MTARELYQEAKNKLAELDKLDSELCEQKSALDETLARISCQIIHEEKLLDGTSWKAKFDYNNSLRLVYNGNSLKMSEINDLCFYGWHSILQIQEEVYLELYDDIISLAFKDSWLMKEIIKQLGLKVDFSLAAEKAEQLRRELVVFDSFLDKKD